MQSVFKQPSKKREAKASLVRAEFLLASGDAEASITCARAILRRDRSQVGALEVLAKGLWQLSRYDDLLVTLTTLIRLNPYEPGYHALRGATYQALGKSGEAIKSFGRAGAACETASASIAELRQWQEGLVADLIREDPVFRAHYAQDPEEAFRARGFDFGAELKSGESWFAQPHVQSVAFTRPS